MRQMPKAAWKDGAKARLRAAGGLRQKLLKAISTLEILR
jgi:hypothetical protein